MKVTEMKIKWDTVQCPIAVGQRAVTKGLPAAVGEARARVAEGTSRRACSSASLKVIAR